MKYPVILIFATVLLTACNTTPASNPQPGNPQPGNPVVKYLNPTGEWKIKIAGRDFGNLVIRDSNSSGMWFWSTLLGADNSHRLDMKGSYTKSISYPYEAAMSFMDRDPFPDKEEGGIIEPTCSLDFNGDKRMYSGRHIITGRFIDENRYEGQATLQVCRNNQFVDVTDRVVPVTATKISALQFPVTDRRQ